MIEPILCSECGLLNHLIECSISTGIGFCSARISFISSVFVKNSIGTESMTAGKTAGEVIRSGSARVDHNARFSRSQVASARVVVKSLILPEGKLAAPFTSIFLPAIRASSWASASLTRNTISAALMPSKGFFPSTLLMTTWLGRKALMTWFDGGGGGARFDEIINPSAAASAHDLGLAGRLLAVRGGVGFGGFAAVRVLSCCSSLSSRVVASSGP